MDQRTVPGRAGKDGAVFLQERFVVRSYGDGVRALVLVGETDVVAHVVFLLVSIFNLRKGGFEQVAVLRRYRESEVDRTVLPAHILLALDEVLGERRTHFIGIAVELQHALGLGPIAEALGTEKRICGGDGVVGGFAENGRVVEGEFLDIVCEFLYSLGLVGENVLEHARGCARGRYELALAVDFSRVSVCCCLLQPFFGEFHYSAADGGGSNYLE